MLLTDPTDIAGLVQWLDANQLGLANNDPVSTWTDESGSGFDMTQSGTARPTFKTGIVNGLPVVRFDGTNDFMACLGGIEGAAPLTNRRIAMRSSGGGSGDMSAQWTAPGDVVVREPQDGNECYVLFAVTGTATTPTGWTVVQSGTQGSIHWYLYHRTAGPSESSTLTIPTSATTGSDSAVMVGVAMTNAGQVVVGTAQPATSTTATAPSVTAPSDRPALVVSLLTGIRSSGSWPTPTGWTNIDQYPGPGGTGGSGAFGLVSGRESVAEGAASGDATSTNAGGSDNVGVQIAFCPSVTPPKTPTPDGYTIMVVLAHGDTSDDQVYDQRNSALEGSIKTGVTVHASQVKLRHRADGAGFGAPTDYTLSTTFGSTFHVITGRWDEAAMIAEKDGVAGVGTVAATVHPTTEQIILGAAKSPSAGGTLSAYFTGDIAEVVLYDSALTDDEVKSLVCYASRKYGLGIPICGPAPPLALRRRPDDNSTGSPLLPRFHGTPQRSAALGAGSGW